VAVANVDVGPDWLRGGAKVGDDSGGRGFI
jgi:hypothetical protein